MAPEDDKTPDNKNTSADSSSSSDKQHTSVSKLNDGELKALLDEAITYKNPKDREGKSALFKDLLLEAEENERNARAASAGGSELVRYCNPSAKRHGRTRRSETSCCSSISENVTHGGSLNNLAKEELYGIVSSHTNRPPKKSVSARQREGGSLPCDVNVGVCGLDRSFLVEEVRKSKLEHQQQEQPQKNAETERLLEHDTLNRNYGVTGGGGGGGGGGAGEQPTTTEIVPTRIPRIPVKYTSSAILHVGNDGDVTLSALDNSAPDKVNETATNNACTLNANYNVLISGASIFNSRTMDDKKVDENGNALGGAQNTTDTKKSKKKKIQTEKNVVVTEAKYVAGHRGDIINDLDKLIEFIRGTENTGTKPKSNVHKSKLHKHVSSSEEKSSKKRRAASSKSKTSNDTRNLKKSSSLDEMTSSVNLARDDDDDDEEEEEDEEEEVVVNEEAAAGKNNVDRTRERRSWGNTEPLQAFQAIELENVESAADFRVVTKKKKSKKRRNSISGQQSDNNSTTMPSSARATASSVPHSEKSNDSSDIDSVHSLPVDTKKRCKESDERQPISYATIAKNQQQQQQQQQQKVAVKRPKEKKVPILSPPPPPPAVAAAPPQTVTQGVQTSPLQHYSPPPPPPPDVHNTDNFPTIQQQPQPQQQQKCVTTGSAVVAASKNGAKKVTAIPNKTVHLPKPQEEHNHPYLQNIQGDIQPMPPNITDVRTIEKMHFAQVQQQQQQQQQQQRQQIDNNNCDSVERTNNNDGSNRPAVVIMNGETTTREVSGLEFGFEINEELLSDDVCDTFMARFVSPPRVNTNLYNHDKIVSFIGQAWDDLVDSENVQYYSENL